MPPLKLNSIEEGVADSEPGDRGQMLRQNSNMSSLIQLKWPLALFVLSLLCNILTFCIVLFQVVPHSHATSSPASDLVTPSEVCSSRGIIHIDAPSQCECYQCYVGPQCNNEVPTCILGADSGNPLMFEKYWSDLPNLTLPLSPAFRIGYRISGQTSMFQLPSLENAIRDMHLMVGNVVPEVLQQHSLIIGVGSTQLINAVIWAMVHKRRPRVFTAHAPYYSAYPFTVSLQQSELAQWKDEVADGDDVVEFVTSPNNPDGLLRGPTHTGAEVVYDLAYYWPHFTPIVRPLAYDIMLFTLSKVTGHAGTRIGWAFVKDQDIANGMKTYIATSTFGASHEAQLHAWQVLQYMVSSKGEPLKFAAQEMHRRWTRLQALQAVNTRLGFSIQPLASPEMCMFNKKVISPSPAYAWLHCEVHLRDGENCGQRLLNVSQIMGRQGEQYGASREYVRLSLLMRPEEFDMMATRLEKFTYT